MKRRRGRYLCAQCLAERRLTLEELILCTSAGPLRCPDRACRGRAYLVPNARVERWLRAQVAARPAAG